jgi:hypothetical protein
MRKYNTLLVTGSTAIRIPIIKRAVVDFALGADWSPAAGDVKTFVDGAAVANITNLPTAIASGNTAQWEFILTAAELSCKQLLVMISDSATKAIEDQCFIVETFGHASAMYQADLSLPNLPANVTQLLGTAWLTPGVAGTPDVNAKQLGAAPVTATTSVTFPSTCTVATTTGAVGSVTGAVGSVTGLTASDVGAIKTKTDFLPSATAGAAGGVFIAGTNAATTITTGLTTTFTGNLTGSVGSVTAGVKSYEDGSIWVDTVNGATGTTLYTHGMATTPVAFVTDVTSLIGSAKIKRVQVVNNSAITLEATHTGEEWEGHSWTLALGGRNIANSHFIGATVSGTGTGAGAEFMECFIDTVSLPTMIAKACGLSGTFTVTATGIYTFDQCYTAVAAGGDWILDFAAIGATTIGLRHFAGSIEVRNMAAGDVLVVAGTGRITLTAPCAGTMHVRGNFELVPGSATTTITDSARWNEDQRLANVTLADTVTTVTGLTASDVGAIKTKTDFLPSVTAGNAGGVFIAGTNAATTVTTAFTTTFTGNLTGSVASVTGAVGSLTTNNDKTGYSLLATTGLGNQTANITGTITTTTNLTTNNDKAGYSLTATTGLGNQTADITGNLSGSVGSVTGAVGSVAGLTASDVGAIKTKTDYLPSATAGAAGGVFIAGTNAATTVTTALTTTFTGNVTGSVGSLTTNNDKTGYALSATGSAALTEDYAADGAAPTLNQILYMLYSALSQFSISSTTLTTKKLDGTTTSMVFDLDSATVPTSRTRSS